MFKFNSRFFVFLLSWFNLKFLGSKWRYFSSSKKATFSIPYNLFGFPQSKRKRTQNWLECCSFNKAELTCLPAWFWSTNPTINRYRYGSCDYDNICFCITVTWPVVLRTYNSLGSCSNTRLDNGHLTLLQPKWTRK